ncbi:neuropeptide-like protein C4orf48 homolog [Oncorhynchus nerka]|uniref:neuropeptide-like protein C4orf48 homolog n=1 Tax=Oncorhynchus nerka TaxID=8023 RepID=UPI0011308891|nr:neuropeptide-like protein C4orf48 homolog [Oncorhynchus nerka]
MLRNMIAAYPKVSKAAIRSLRLPGLPLDMMHGSMASSGYLKAVMLLLAVQLLSLRPGFGEQETGTAIPAERRPCVDCHGFEFMQRALQDLKKTGFKLDAQTETLVLREKR